MRQHEGERILQIVRPGVPLSLLMKPAPNPPSSHDLHHGGNLEEFVSDPVALLACTTQKLLANSTSPKSHSGTQHNLPYTTDVHREAPHPIWTPIAAEEERRGANHFRSKRTRPSFVHKWN
jgi:hypothetical protein